METKDNWELLDWQKEILKMEEEAQYHMMGAKEVFLLKKEHKEMIEKLLYPTDSVDFYIVEKYQTILNRVLLSGVYREEDKEALNYVRDYYLKGKN